MTTPKEGLKEEIRAKLESVKSKSTSADAVLAQPSETLEAVLDEATKVIQVRLSAHGKTLEDMQANEIARIVLDTMNKTVNPQPEKAPRNI